MSFLGWRIRRAWFWIEGHGLVIVLVIASVVGIGTPLLLRHEAHERQEQICEWASGQQEVLRALLDTVLVDGGGDGQRPALLRPAAFAALPESMKAYLRELAAQQPTDDPSDTIAERLSAFRDEQLGDDDLPNYCRERS